MPYWKKLSNRYSKGGSKRRMMVRGHTAEVAHGSKAALTIETADEALELDQIRSACLAEVLLAYITVLNFSARFVSREYLLKCLELGAAIASKDSDLASTFVATGRMAELVDALAATSTSMLHAEESAKGSKKGSAKLSIWSGKGSLRTS